MHSIPQIHTHKKCLQHVQEMPNSACVQDDSHTVEGVSRIALSFSLGQLIVHSAVEVLTKWVGAVLNFQSK